MYMYRYVVTFCLSGCPDVGLNLFFFNDAKLTEYYTLSLHDALPIYRHVGRTRDLGLRGGHGQVAPGRDRHEVDARRRAGVAQPADDLGALGQLVEDDRVEVEPDAARGEGDGRVEGGGGVDGAEGAGRGGAPVGRAGGDEGAGAGGVAASVGQLHDGQAGDEALERAGVHVDDRLGVGGEDLLAQVGEPVGGDG